MMKCSLSGLHLPSYDIPCLGVISAVDLPHIHVCWGEHTSQVTPPLYSALTDNGYLSSSMVDEGVGLFMWWTQRWWMCEVLRCVQWSWRGVCSRGGALANGHTEGLSWRLDVQRR